METLVGVLTIVGYFMMIVLLITLTIILMPIIVPIAVIIGIPLAIIDFTNKDNPQSVIQKQNNTNKPKRRSYDMGKSIRLDV